MTTQELVNKLIAQAESRNGYLEKSKSAYKKNKQIVYELTDGAGSDNYTECWEDVRPGFQGNAWCCCWVYWCFMKAFGADMAKKMLYVDTWAPKDRWDNFDCSSWVSNWTLHNAKYQSSKAQIGDIIYFTKSHTGIVYKITEDTVYTIEGNTSGASGVIRNGGGVCKKKYVRGEDAIWCYGRPNWNAGVTVDPEPTPTPKTRPTIKSGYKDSEKGGTYCKELQEALNKLKYTDQYNNELVVDGSCGKKTVAAITKFQQANGLEDDGSCGPKTWAKIDECLATFVSKQYVWVTADGGLNVRSGIGTSNPVVKVIAHATKHSYTDYKDGWYYLNEIPGWANGSFLKKI